MNLTLNQASIIQRFRQLLLGFSLLGLTCQVSAQTQVDDAWVRATVAGQQATGAFMTITSSSDSKLLSAQSPVAKIVQLHLSTMKNDVMSMQPVEFIELPAREPVTLDPHKYHVMLIDLVEQVKEGDKVPLTLTIENAKGEKESIKVEATARALNMPDHSKMH
ncbi:copper chaperone PCu(A)C [Pseudomonas caspiana]|uniref:copper chaperone PCu(A)C n=1 Tax=Pseudomonas caspiana TaxID=1451454 RepID=UPI0032EF999D